MTIPREQLEAWNKLADAATPGPWMNSVMGVVASNGDIPCHDPVMNDDNANFIAASRTAIPALIAEVERLREMMPHICATCIHCADDYALDIVGMPIFHYPDVTLYKCSETGKNNPVSMYCNISKWQLCEMEGK